MAKQPFDNEKFVGYISRVSPYFSTIHFPSSKLLKKFWHFHEELTGGIVGQYVVIEGENYGFLGRIQEISLPEKYSFVARLLTFSLKLMLIFL